MTVLQDATAAKALRMMPAQTSRGRRAPTLRVQLPFRAHMLFRLPAAIACALAATLDPVDARTIITHGEYAAGVLVVRGATPQPNQTVTLDGRYETRSDADGQFRFRLRYRPPNCRVEIRADGATRPVSISNCDAGGAIDPVDPLVPKE